MSSGPSALQQFRLIGTVLWRIRFDLLAVAVVAAAMAELSTAVPLESLAAVVPLIIGVAIMALFVVAERMGYLAEGALGNSALALLMSDYCAPITADLLGADHPLAAPLRGK
jgi:hypothetical protein